MRASKFGWVICAVLWAGFGVSCQSRRLLEDDDAGVVIDTNGGPVDVYLLADNTGSMSAEIANVRENALGIFNEISRNSSDVFWGVGAYRDTGDDFTFRNFLPVTELPPEDIPEDQHPILKAINKWSAQGGGDHPEAQLYALYKVAIGADEIGWRTDANKIVVWFGDAPGHDPVKFGGSLVTETKVIKALQEAGIQVLAIDVAGLNELGQAQSIADSTNGRYSFIGRQEPSFFTGEGTVALDDTTGVPRTEVPAAPLELASFGTASVSTSSSVMPTRAATRVTESAGSATSGPSSSVSDAIVTGVGDILSG